MIYLTMHVENIMSSCIALGNFTALGYGHI